MKKNFQFILVTALVVFCLCVTACGDEADKLLAPDTAKELTIAMLSDEECEHEYVDDIVEPTCHSKGYTKHTCSKCNKSYIDEITNESAHTPGAEATCTEAQHCTVCNAVIAEAKGHVAGNAATCTAPQICTVCEVVLVEATGHVFAEDCHCDEENICSVCGETIQGGEHTWVEATCTEAKHCSVCGVTEGESLGHTWVEATCTEAKHCSVCSVTEGEPNGHDYTDELVSPTCTRQGYTLHVCEVCSHVEIDNYVSPLGHHYVGGTCSECNDTLAENLRTYGGIGIAVAENLDCTMEITASSKTNYGKNIADGITVYSYGSTNSNKTTVSSKSTAVIINDDGYLVTNAHCVTFTDDLYGEVQLYDWFNRPAGTGIGAVSGTETRVYDSIKVNFKNDSEKYTVEVVAYDIVKDLAIIKFAESSVPVQYEHVEIADSDELVLGEEVGVLGNAGGLGISVTTGVVSNYSRYDDEHTEELVQTDAAVNPGNSGGGMYNASGELIGIVSAKIVSSDIENIGFAIASNSLVRYIETVEQEQTIEIEYTMAA